MKNKALARLGRVADHVLRTWLDFPRSPMANFTQDLRYSVRSLRKSPGFALTAILTLALGIGAVTAIFSVVNSVLLRPFAFPDPGRLVMLRETMLQLSPDPLPINPRHFLNWQANAKTLSGMAAFQNHAVSLSSGTDHPEIVNGLGVASNFFSVLGVHPVLGRDFCRPRGPRDAITKLSCRGTRGSVIFTAILAQLDSPCASVEHRRPWWACYPGTSACRT
jgi:hypothetical protein